LLRGGSRNAFDGDRNSGALPENMQQLCDHAWDRHRLGNRSTVTCSGNATHQASRIAVDAVARLPILMARRLMQMRLPDSARLLDRWWLIALDGTLQDRGHATKGLPSRYRYVVEAKLVGPAGTMIPLMTEFMDVRDPVREKEDCELNAFRRLAVRLHTEFPRLPICLLLDGLYAVEVVFDLCTEHGWKFITTLREGRQPTAWGEAVETMRMDPALVAHAIRAGEHGRVEQTLRWTHQVPFGRHTFDVLFSGEIGPEEATLWTWVTNFTISHGTADALANQGGRARQGIENVFNVEKNGGFGLEHAFCANDTAAKNYHLMMQVAHIISQLLVNGFLRGLTRACRKLSDKKLIELVRASLLNVVMDRALPTPSQIRFYSSA
jgi:hypothetical protein